MSMFKTLFGIERKIFNLVKEGADLCTKGASQAEMDAHWEKVDKVGRSSSRESMSEIKYQIQSRLRKHLSTTSLTALEAESQLERYWHHLQTEAWLADRRRITWNKPNYGREMPKWMRVLSIVGGVAFGAWFIIGLATHDSVTIPSIQQQQIEAAKHTAETTHLALDSVTVSTSDFENMFDSLEAPAPVDEPPLPAAAIAPAVAAVEAESVTIEMETPQGTRNFTSTVGRVYRTATPEVREQMEAPKIDHGYDHPDPHDCTVIHCLTSHKDFTVTADFDSGGKQTAHLRY